MSDNLCVCPDGRVRPKVWHLFKAVDSLTAVCGMAAFGDNTKKSRVLGACNPHCFTEKKGRVNCPMCLRSMEKGLPT